jgi:hypothetical protein
MSALTIGVLLQTLNKRCSERAQHARRVTASLQFCDRERFREFGRKTFV